MDQKIPKSKTEEVVWGKVQDFRNGSELQFVKFDFVTVCPVLVEFWWNPSQT